MIDLTISDPPKNKRKKPKARPEPLVDRYGHPHSESVFLNWTPAAIKALGIRRREGAA
jgi:hypothetical protein